MVRRVASQEGVKYYDLPMGAPITAAVLSGARIRNNGKSAPKGASKTSRVGSASSPKTPDAKNVGIGAGSTDKTPALGKATAPTRTAGVRTVSELETTKISKTKLKGKHTIEVGGKEYGIPDGSKAFGSSPDSQLVYVITPDSELHVFVSEGEATLKPMETERLKGILVAHADRMDERELGGGDDYIGSGDVAIMQKKDYEMGEIPSGEELERLSREKTKKDKADRKAKKDATSSGNKNSEKPTNRDMDKVAEGDTLDIGGETFTKLEDNDTVAELNLWKDSKGNERTQGDILGDPNYTRDKSESKEKKAPEKKPTNLSMDGTKIGETSTYDGETYTKVADNDTVSQLNLWKDSSGKQRTQGAIQGDPAYLEFEKKPRSAAKQKPADKKSTQAQKKAFGEMDAAAEGDTYDFGGQTYTKESSNDTVAELNLWKNSKGETETQGAILGDPLYVAHAKQKPESLDIDPKQEETKAQKSGRARQAAAMQVLTDSGFLEADDERKAEIRKELLAAAKELRNPNSLGEGVGSLQDDEIDALLASEYSKHHVDEHGNFDAERQKLHNKIIESYLDGLEAQDAPTQYMNGGGPASGKGTMTRGANAALTNYPTTRKIDETTGAFLPFKGKPEALLIDPDSVKMQLPEVQAALSKIKSGDFELDDTAWAMYAHEESSYISKRLHLAALERGYNVIYDGTGNGSTGSVISKVNNSRARGYEVHANYLYLEPPEGIARAASRAEHSHRIVPEKQIRGTYAKLPEIFDSVKMGVFDKVTLFDNNVERNQPSKVIGTGGGSKFEITDQIAYDRYMSSKDRAWLESDSTPPSEIALQPNLKKSNKSQGKAA